MIKYFQLNSCLEDASDSIFRKTFSVVSITDGYVFIKETWSLNPLKNYALGIWIRYKLLRFYGSHKKLYINRKVRSVIRHSIVLLSVKIISHNERECFLKTFLRVHFFIFKLFGIWVPVNPSWLYCEWQIISLIVIGIGLPLSFFMSFIYSENSEDAMKIPVLLCTILSVSIKCVLIFSKRYHLRELLEVSRTLDGHTDTTSNMQPTQASERNQHMHIRAVCVLVKFCLYCIHLFCHKW